VSGRPYARGFFDLQFSFAERVQALSGISLEQALFEYTNFYVRFGLGRDFDGEHETWRAYLAGLRTAGDPREWTYEFYLNEPEVRTAPAVVATFGCFSYELKEPGVARLHFVNAESDDESPLCNRRVERRRAELKSLFIQLKESAGEDVDVVGTSWLYNLEAYRRLFPPAYVASRRVVRRFRTMPLWGQFVDRRREVKQAAVQSFRRALANLTDVAYADACFPLQPLAVQGVTRDFYTYYGV